MGWLGEKKNLFSGGLLRFTTVHQPCGVATLPKALSILLTLVCKEREGEKKFEALDKMLSTNSHPLTHQIMPTKDFQDVAVDASDF